MSKIKNFAMPLVFLGVLLFSLAFGGIVPDQAKSFFYSISILIKELLVFSLPIIIFILVFGSLTKAGKKSIKYILLIYPLVCCSNFINTMLSYFFDIALPKVGSVGEVASSSSSLSPMFEFSIPFKIASNEVVLALAMVCGVIFVLFFQKLSTRINSVFDKVSSCFFKILMPLMPFFILGTALKLDCDGVLGAIFKQHSILLVKFVVIAYGLITIEYFVLAGFKLEKFKEYISNVFNAVIVGFGSASSVAALPLSIKAAEKNLQDKEKSGIIIPSTVNVHLMGDCFFIPMTALAVMCSFGYGEPSLYTYVIFAIHFVVAKFAVAAVPGGGVLVMIPVMQSYLGFSHEMLALITAIYILFDPVITACNVYGNGAFAIMFDKLTSKKTQS